MTEPPRAPRQRVRDTLDRLEHDVDCWVATADRAATPYLVPLSFRWDGATLLVATPAASVTSRNLQATGKARVGIGPTRDVVLVEAGVETVACRDLPADVGDRFAAKAGFDPRLLEDEEYLYFHLRPLRLQAWREANELRGRELLREGRWVAEPAPG